MVKKPNLFDGKLFDVEHALDIFAYSYITIPAHEIYNTELLKDHEELLKKTHIYLVGYAPKVGLAKVEQIDRKLLTHFTVGGDEVALDWELPKGFDLKFEGELFWVETPDGNRTFPNREASIFRLHKKRHMLFDVKYIGHAYGENGDRNALERLTKHETLQKIALQKTPDDHEIQVVLVEIQPNNHMMTVFNPWAETKDEDGSRIKNALDSLFETSEAQQVSLYEAALIRYFQPEYNKVFKNSFPSTNLKILEQCYDKDMAAVIAEFCIDEMPFFFRSDAVDPMPYHIAGYNIHEKQDRDIFFGYKSGSIDNLASISDDDPQ